MELLQCAKNKSQHNKVKDFLSSYGFVVLPLTENIGHRASIYIEECSLYTGLRAGDEIIAATATKNNIELDYIGISILNLSYTKRYILYVVRVSQTGFYFIMLLSPN